jgi:hypothetical protein
MGFTARWKAMLFCSLENPDSQQTLPSSQQKLGPVPFREMRGKTLDSSFRWNDGEGVCGFTARWKTVLFGSLGNTDSQ